MSSFNVGEVGYYTVKLVAPIEEFDPDQYGNKWYNVLFEGDAETFMWLKKDPPVEGQEVYGHLEPTKSGKRLRFRTDKLPELPQGSKPSAPSSGKSDAYLKDISNTPIMMYNGSLHYAKDAGLNLITDKEDRRAYLEYVKDITDEMLNWIDEIRGGSSQIKVEKDDPPVAPPATSLGDQFRKKTAKPEVTNEFSEEDMPDGAE